jgi:hypothetical protein
MVQYIYIIYNITTGCRHGYPHCDERGATTHGAQPPRHRLPSGPAGGARWIHSRFPHRRPHLRWDSQGSRAARATRGRGSVGDVSMP